jgi:hypothetical protein
MDRYRASSKYLHIYLQRFVDQLSYAAGESGTGSGTAKHVHAVSRGTVMESFVPLLCGAWLHRKSASAVRHGMLVSLLTAAQHRSQLAAGPCRLFVASIFTARIQLTS